MCSRSATPTKVRNLGLVYREHDEEDEELLKPLEWGLIRRMFTYASPQKTKLRALVVMSVVRAAQLPALVWITSLIINGPIAHGDYHGIALGVAGYALLDAQIGFSRDKYHFAIFGDNLTNTHASTWTSSAQFIKSEVTVRPTTYGVKIGYDF